MSETICECGHDLSTHNSKVGMCHHSAFENELSCECSQFTDSRIATLRAEIDLLRRGIAPEAACPCLHTTPCDPRCTCVDEFSSRGCECCCTYGSAEQQRERAERLMELRKDSRMLEWVFQNQGTFRRRGTGIRWIVDMPGGVMREDSPDPIEAREAIDAAIAAAETKGGEG